MAFTTILRRSASSIAPLAIRLAQTPRHNHSAIFTALYHTTLSYKPSSSPFVQTTNHLYSSSAVAKKPSSDEKLLSVIDSEIQCAVEADDYDRVQETPSGFPFEIQDNPGHQTITLKREYQTEVIKVEVHMTDLVTGEDGEDNAADDDEKASESSIPLVVTVSKKNGPSLEFNVTAFPDEIAIDSLAIRDPEISEDQIAYEGPDFSDLDENLQKAFHKYLEIRGIKPSATNFLHEYMINKDSREYVIWLKNLKDFVKA